MMKKEDKMKSKLKIMSGDKFRVSVISIYFLADCAEKLQLNGMQGKLEAKPHLYLEEEGGGKFNSNNKKVFK